MPAWGLLVIAPLIWVILASFKSNTEIFTHAPFSLPSAISFESYRTAWTEASLNARIGGHAPVKLRYGPEGKLRRLDLEADDAGALFRAFDLASVLREG